MMVEKVRLLIFLHDLAPFGAQRVVLYTVRNMERQKIRVTVCAFGGDVTLAQEFFAAGASVALLGAGRFLDPFAWLRLAMLLLKERPCIVQTSLPELSVPVRLLSLLIPGLKVLHTVQNPIDSEPWYWRFLNMLTLPLCSAVVFSSEGLKRHELRARAKLSPRVATIPNGVERLNAAGEGPEALRKEFGCAEGEKVIFCAARLSAQKGQDILIRATAELSRQRERVRLVLAGDGEDLEELRKLSAELGIRDKVVFLGRRADIGSLLGASDVYAAASRWESFDIALGEAMLAGLPCAATDIPGHADLLNGGATGLPVPAGDFEAMAAAIGKIFSDPAGAIRRAAAARDLVSSHYSTAGMAAKYQNLYLELAEGGPK
jgi:glycosyltransferase involved in cell wall biosynthesis